jgi:arylsulfatase A-like enzyme
MPLSPSSDFGDRYSTGILLIGILLFSWLLGIKNLVLDWVNPSTETETPAMPNILLIVADDLGYNDTSAINASGLSTPNLDRLAREGVTFRRHYADATCTPSRVAILTGRYPERSGFRPVGSEIPAEFSTIAEQLRRAGYATYLTGKWHAGEERVDAWPQNKGFDNWFGFLNQWELSGEVTESDKGRKRPTYRNPRLRVDGGELVQYNGHLTDILTDHSLKQLERLQKIGQPWFLYHAFLAPHQPIQPDERFAREHPDTPEGRYTALVAQMDDAVGRLLGAVDREKTLVVFVSDNGGTNSERDNNFPFYGRKGEMFEGAFRTPLIMSWPGFIPEGRTVDEVVMNVDIYPTLLAAAHADAPDGLDGENLWPVLLHDVTTGARSRAWEVYSANVNTLSYSFLSGGGDWRLSNPQGIAHNLFDLIADPSGERDESSKRPEIVSRMSSGFWLEHWRKSLVPVAEHPGIEVAQTRYSGFDAMRTPNRHGFAIGLEIGPLPPDLDRGASETGTVLAGQEGVWQLDYVANQGIEWQLGETRLRDAHFDPSRCNAVIMTGYFETKGHLARREPRSEIKLYSSGLLSDFQRNVAFEPLDSKSLHSPTFVNYGGKARFANIMLSSFADSYAPRLQPQFMEFYTSAFREKRLSLADVSMMDSQLCN